MNESPFVVMFQQVEVPVERAGVKGLIWGPSFDNNLYRLASKK
jgi:peptide/nickel transport system substrate-binding protein